MKVVILAAGVGNRLGDYNRDRPKCLLEVGGKTLLERMIESLLRFDVSPIIIGVGYEHEQIEGEVSDRFPGADVRLCYNPEFHKGSVLSLNQARENLDDEFLLMDADVLFHDDILKRLLTTQHPNCFLIDRDFVNDGEAMVAMGRNCRITGYDRGLDPGDELAGESVGFFRISREFCTPLNESMNRHIEAGDLDMAYESLLTELIREHEFGYEDITGMPWTEIDFVEDVERARDEILPLLELNIPVRRYTLLNPGPGNTTGAVRKPLVGLPDLCHREEEFFQVMQEIRSELPGIVGVDDQEYSSIIFTGSGTAAVEATIAGVVPENGKLLVIDNGVYGDRMRKMAEAHRIPHEVLKYSWTEPPVPSDIASALEKDENITHVAMVHHETTTGLLNPVHEVGEVTAKFERTLIVDAMSSFGGEQLHLADDHVDFAISSSNKCLQGLPGLSFVVARRSLLEALEDVPARSVYLDLYNQWKQEESDNTPFTPAIQIFFSLREAIAELKVETIQGRLERFAACAKTLRDGMLALGFQILVPEPARSNLLTAFQLPKGVDYSSLHDAMKRRGYIIYAGQSNLKDTAFRIANIGALKPEDMRGVVLAIRESIAELRI